MGNLVLVSHHLCPYVQRAAITLLEKGAPFARRYIDLAAKPDWFRRISPTGKVPLLIVDDQHVLFESAAICDFLDETLEPRLHPQDPLERAQHRAWIEYASGTLNAIGRLYNSPNQEAFSSDRQVLEARLHSLEEVISENAPFSAERFTLVDAAFAPVFRYFDVLDEVLGEQTWHAVPKVRAWRERLMHRPSVRNAVGPEYADRLRAFLLARGSYLSGLLGSREARSAAFA